MEPQNISPPPEASLGDAVSEQVDTPAQPTSLVDARNQAKRKALLLDALRAALAEATEQRLYRSGKLTGLFASKSGLSGDAAHQAIRDGLLEVVRVENKGKNIIEWVRLTPAGIAFLHEHDSPQALLDELRQTLQTTREGIPTWLTQFHAEIRSVTERFTQELAKVQTRLDALSERIEHTLRRLSTAPIEQASEWSQVVPWAVDALTYLDRRRQTATTAECPMPELFAALSARHPNLSLTAFHDGLRRLSEVRALRLLPPAADTLAEPEFALLDGSRLLYLVVR